MVSSVVFRSAFVLDLACTALERTVAFDHFFVPAVGAVVQTVGKLFAEEFVSADLGDWEGSVSE